MSEFSNYDFNSQQFECDSDDLTKEFVRSISTEVFDNRKAFQNEIRERVKSIVLSPSRVNDYLTCPRKFFYLKVLGIDVEEAQLQIILATNSSILYFQNTHKRKLEPQNF